MAHEQKCATLGVMDNSANDARTDTAADTKGALNAQENLACDECGRYGAIDLGEKKLCLDCYGSYGSCCPEFGKEEAD